jgi:DNA-binding NarL/FixJ family response regulator
MSIDDLSACEYQTVELLFQGYRQKEIAVMLGLTDKSLRMRVQRIAARLGIDGDRFSLQVRIVYLLAQAKGLISGIPSTATPHKQVCIHVV